MHSFPDVLVDPEVEQYKDIPDGETDDWCGARVHKDVLDTARRRGFTADQISEWTALFDRLPRSIDISCTSRSVMGSMRAAPVAVRIASLFWMY